MSLLPSAVPAIPADCTHRTDYPVADPDGGDFRTYPFNDPRAFMPQNDWQWHREMPRENRNVCMADTAGPYTNHDIVRARRTRINFLHREVVAMFEAKGSKHGYSVSYREGSRTADLYRSRSL